MRRLLAAAAAALLAVAGCSEPGDEGDRELIPDQDPQPTWSVGCESGPNPIDGVGELTLPCLGEGSETAVGVGDRPLVVTLWASWCQPCLEEAPEIEAFYRAFGDRIDVLGVDTADTREKGRWFAEEFDFTFPSVFDADEELRTAFGVPGLPGIAFVDPDGTVAEVVNEPGVTTESLTETAESAFGLDLE
ncbi:TlpA family protein disulfide reductase [Glycomyces salinus]|uniref:TlpA family protein disulfide reductase n=1 Tax=Glycomyces salinus TaxID=980294 RepID=UPI0018EB42AE|nr:TlpA disulfide reductase family protein [Glycomyces salinus]